MMKFYNFLLPLNNLYLCPFMSHAGYDELLAQALDQLRENNKQEKEPQIMNDVGRPQFDDWPDDEVF